MAEAPAYHQEYGRLAKMKGLRKFAREYPTLPVLIAGIITTSTLLWAMIAYEFFAVAIAGALLHSGLFYVVMAMFVGFVVIATKALE